MGEKLFALQKARGWSQEELADRIGVTRQAVSRWESNTAKPDADKIIALCKLFGVTADYLLGIEITPVPGEDRTQKQPVLLDRTTGGWVIVVLSVIALCVGFVLEEYTKGLAQDYYWLLCMGVAGVVLGIGMAPGAKLLENERICLHTGRTATAIGGFMIGVCILYFIRWPRFFDWNFLLLWPNVYILIFGILLLRLHKKQKKS